MIINDTDKNLMIMRPYQVYATQKLNSTSNSILMKVAISGILQAQEKHSLLLNVDNY